MLFFHGSGATTHSMVGLFDVFAARNRVTAIDLPGHGFTSPLGFGSPTLENVSAGIGELCTDLKIDPQIVVGHSAGAAIAVRMISRGLVAPKLLVSINGAFYPFAGSSAPFMSAMAKLLFLNPLTPRLFAFGASDDRVRRLMESTGSEISSDSLGFYRRALGSSAHIAGALELMANWDLEPVANEISVLEVPMLQIIGAKDGTIEPMASVRTEELLANGSRTVVPDTGHLVHEEQPENVAKIITEFAKELGLMA